MGSYLVVRRVFLLAVEVHHLIWSTSTSPLGKVMLKKEHHHYGTVVFSPGQRKRLAVQHILLSGMLVGFLQVSGMMIVCL